MHRCSKCGLTSSDRMINWLDHHIHCGGKVVYYPPVYMTRAGDVFIAKEFVNGKQHFVLDYRRHKIN